MLIDADGQEQKKVKKNIQPDEVKAAKRKKRKKRIQKRVIQAAGGLLWRESERGKELAVVHRPYYDDWVLPKGKLGSREDWAEAALREVTEETNCQPRLKDYAGCICYLVNNKPKIVLFWYMELIGDCDFEVNNETDQILWLTVEEAKQKLKYSTERSLLE
jgi:8-oxo-dGTP diphosphatase